MTAEMFKELMSVVGMANETNRVVAGYQVEIDEETFTAATTLGEVESLIHGSATEEKMPQYHLPRWAQRFPFPLIRRILLYLIVFPLVRLMCPLRVRGRELLSAAHGPHLFVSNHVTMTDHALILAALPAKFRHRLAIAMEGERLLGWLHPPAETGWFTRLRYRVQYALVVTFFNVFPLPQKSGFRRSFAFAGEMVDRGYHILIFPEGRSTTDGLMGPFKVGTGLLAINLGVPVIPIRIDGLFELKRRRQHFASFGQVSIKIGEPIQYSSREEAAAITADLQKRVANL